MTVIPPSIDCVLGDKLTAFAPHTTGVPLGKEKDSEVIKQFYDVSTLIDAFENFDDVRKTYFSVCRTELGYRGSSTTPEEALRDALRAAICIGSRGKTSAGDFSYYNKGTREITNHIYKRGFSKHLTLVELFCHGVTTSQTHEKYLTTIAKRKTIKAFSVKAKHKGWQKNSYIEIETIDGEMIREHFYSSAYGYAFAHLSRRSCYSCQFKGQQRVGDISIGDYWGILQNGTNYNKDGVSVIQVHTYRGKELVDACHEYLQINLIEHEKSISDNAWVERSIPLGDREEYAKRFASVESIYLPMKMKLKKTIKAVIGRQ